MRHPLSSAVFDELESDDFEMRFAACEAVDATVWGLGMQACRTPVERVMWQARYLTHLERQHAVWRYSTTEPRAAMSPDVAPLGVHPRAVKQPPATCL